MMSRNLQYENPGQACKLDRQCNNDNVAEWQGTSDKWWVMSDERWVMSDEWWVIRDKWWVMIMCIIAVGVTHVQSMVLGTWVNFGTGAWHNDQISPRQQSSRASIKDEHILPLKFPVNACFLKKKTVHHDRGAYVSIEKRLQMR